MEQKEIIKKETVYSESNGLSKSQLESQKEVGGFILVIGKASVQEK